MLADFRGVEDSEAERMCICRLSSILRSTKPAFSWLSPVKTSEKR